ncbi:MAG: YicC family protein [Bacteroidales bacterium]|nr:YicC family protein [Bacteroidales bacterium]MDT3360505.1 YicC family protein [Bacteroidota bacterium]
MTGYGKAEVILSSGCKMTVEIRTLNGKSADIGIKSQILPKDKELAIRSMIAQRLQRGTIDVYITLEQPAQVASHPINTELLKSYLDQVRAFEKEQGIAADATDAQVLATLLRFPDVLDAKKADAITEEDLPLLDQVFDQAISAVENYREKEGRVLDADVRSRIANIQALYDQVEAFEPERIEAVRAKLQKNLEDLAQKVDPQRFEQEMVFYLEKLDINEEKVRLRQHCKYFLETMESDPYPGKKLGFIIQEIGREINTTGSKANHSGIQRCVTMMKDELEKMREQSMNIL